MVTDLLFGALSTPGLLHYFTTPGVLLSSLLAYAKREPVAIAAFLLAAVIVAVSLVTGVPVAAILGQVAAVVALFVKVRSTVAPMVDVVVHSSDVPAGAIPVFMQAPAADPAP